MSDADTIREARNLLKPLLSIPPSDCTNRCGDGPCDCSGKWRAQAYSAESVDAALRLVAGSAPDRDAALREITQTNWDASEGITPFQFEQRIHAIAAAALGSPVEPTAQREDELRAFLKTQPCTRGFGDPEVACIDAVPSNTRRMCLRCRILLYTIWPHGFPTPPVVPSVDAPNKETT